MVMSAYFINYCVIQFTVCFFHEMYEAPWTWQFAFDLMEILESPNETIWVSSFINTSNLQYWHILKKNECNEKMLQIYRGKYFDLCSPLRHTVPIFPACSYLCPADIAWSPEKSRNNPLSPLSSLVCVWILTSYPRPCNLIPIVCLEPHYFISMAAPGSDFSLHEGPH